jgi:hypothetical protein
LRLLDDINKKNKKVFQSYLWVTKNRPTKPECWEARVSTKDQLLIAQGQFKNDEHNFSTYLNDWGPIKKLDLMNL